MLTLHGKPMCEKISTNEFFYTDVATHPLCVFESNQSHLVQLFFGKVTKCYKLFDDVISSKVFMIVSYA